MMDPRRKLQARGYAIACELIRRLDLNSTLRYAGIPLTYTDEVATAETHQAWRWYLRLSRS